MCSVPASRHCSCPSPLEGSRSPGGTGPAARPVTPGRQDLTQPSALTVPGTGQDRHQVVSVVEDAGEIVVESEKTYRPHPLEVASSASGGIVVVTVSGAIDHASVGPLVQALDSGRLAGRSCVIVDMQHVSFMDSSGINAFLATHRDLTRAGGWLRLAGVPDSVRRTLRRVGVDAVIPCYPGLREALAA